MGAESRTDAFEEWDALLDGRPAIRPLALAFTSGLLGTARCLGQGLDDDPRERHFRTANTS